MPQKDSNKYGGDVIDYIFRNEGGSKNKDMSIQIKKEKEEQAIDDEIIVLDDIDITSKSVVKEVKIKREGSDDVEKPINKFVCNTCNLTYNSHRGLCVHNQTKHN